MLLKIKQRRVNNEFLKHQVRHPKGFAKENMDKNIIHHDVELKKFNSWKVGGTAEQFLICDEKDILADFSQALETIEV